MKRRAINILIFTALMTVTVSPARGDSVMDYDLPDDLPTIEALISLHKVMKHEEDEAMKRVTESFGEQSLVTKGARLFNDVRTTLDSKLSSAYSYVLLAGALSSTGNSLYRLIRDYADFTSEAMDAVSHKPMVGWYYTEAVYACSREIKGIKAAYATMTAAGINVMKASMSEKLDLVLDIKTRIDVMLGIISNARLWCSAVAIGGFAHDYIWDILNSQVLDGIAENVISNWANS